MYCSTVNCRVFQKSHYVKLSKSAKSLKILQKSSLFIDDKLRETTMIAGHLKKHKLLKRAELIWKEG